MEKKEGASDSKHSWFLGSFQSQFVCQYSNYYCMPEEGADWMRLTFSQYHTKHSTIHESGAIYTATLHPYSARLMSSLISCRWCSKVRRGRRHIL